MHKFIGKERAISDIVKITFARYFSQTVGIVTSFALRNFLGPFYMGVWSLLRIVVSYASYLFLGADYGAANRVPYFSGSKELDKEADVKNTVFSFISGVSLLIGVAVIAWAFMMRNSYDREMIVGIIVIAFYIIFDKFCGYYQLLLRAKRDFSTLSGAIIFDAVMNVVLVFVFVKHFRIYGVYAMIMVAVLANILFIHFFARYTFKFKFNFATLRSVVKVGFPITVIGLLQGVLGSLDRIMIAKWIGITFVGYYSIPVMARGYLGQLSNFGTVLYPQMMEEYGENKDIGKLKKYVVLPIIINAYIMPILLGGIFFIGPVVIRAVTPKFIPGIVAMQILLIDMYFKLCSVQAEHFLIALNKQKLLIVPLIGAVGINISLNYIFIMKGFGISGVAWGTNITSLLIFVFLQYFAMSHFEKNAGILKFIAHVMFPIAYLACVVFVLERVVRVENIYIGPLLKTGLMCILYAPLVFFINKSTGIISLIMGMIKKRWKGVRT